MVIATEKRKSVSTAGKHVKTHVKNVNYIPLRVSLLREHTLKCNEYQASISHLN